MTVLMVAVLLLNLLAATQDIATDGLAVDLLAPAERGLANGIQVAGYRVGMIVGGGLLLILPNSSACRAPSSPWPRSPPSPPCPSCWPASPRPHRAPRSAAAGKHSTSFGARVRFALLGLVVTYKAGDAFATGMLRPFLADAGLSLVGHRLAARNGRLRLRTARRAGRRSARQPPGAQNGPGRLRAAAGGRGRPATPTWPSAQPGSRRALRDLRGRALRGWDGHGRALHLHDGLVLARDERHRLHRAGERGRDRDRPGLGSGGLQRAGPRLLRSLLPVGGSSAAGRAGHRARCFPSARAAALIRGSTEEA